MRLHSISQSLKLRGVSSIARPSSLVLLAAALLLAGCGFQLRGQAALPFESLHVSGPLVFANQIARSVRASSHGRWWS